jgi:glycosyltransferase involved in cell wall biosynthesis
MIPDDKIFTVPNCVDDEYLMSDQEFNRKIERISERRTKHILYLSNFIPAKGYRKVLEMAKLESENRGMPRFHFDFAGAFFEKAEETYFYNFIRDNNLEEYVTYHGVVEGDKKRALLKLCDVFVLLSTYPNEGQPISILEAMGNGMIIITTNHAGIPDEVTDGENGIVTDKNNIDTNEIYNRLLAFDQYEKVEKLNRSIVIEKFSQENYIDGMQRCFLSLLGMD